MINDALFILWDCSIVSDKPQDEWSGRSDDKEMYGRICDIARGHHRIQAFVNGYSFRSRKTHAIPTNPSTFGLYSQALSEGIDEVLRSYKETLIEIEKEILSNHNLTMSYVYGRVDAYRGLFNTLNRMITCVKERRLRGCQILSLAHQHILSGSEAVRTAVLKIFARVNAVFVNQLCSWLLYGELKDPYQEFFIYSQHDRTDFSETASSSPSVYEKTLATSIRETPMDFGCAINMQLVPHFIPLSLAQDILFIGKTVILFGFDPKNVRKSTQSHANKLLVLQTASNTQTRRFTIWYEKEVEFHEKLEQLKKTDSEVSDLRAVTNEIKVCVTQHLWLVTVREAHLLHELRLLKDFYLLGRGELFLEMLRLSSHILDAPANRNSTRDINQALQVAARAVQLAGSADLDKFTLHLPYVKPQVTLDSSADTTLLSDGWSSIVMKYDFKWPLHLLFTPETLAKYNDMFRLLLRIKKTQHDLHALWKDYKHRSFSMCQLHNKLMFLMDNLQHYLQADVLETNFSKLVHVAENTHDFQELKGAHAAFLSDILTQSFLTVMPSGDSSVAEEPSDVIDNPVFNNIMDLLKLCHSFCGMSHTIADQSSETYHLTGYTERFDTLVAKLLQLLTSLRSRPCGACLARLLMRLDYNRWFSSTAHLTQSITNMLY